MNSNIQYLLDTNIISDLVRNPHGLIRDRIAFIGEDTVCTSIIVTSELHFGVEKKGSLKLRNQLEIILSAIVILPFEEPTDRQYALLRSNLEKKGTLIGPNDMLIAAQAMNHGLTLVTGNTREFSQIQGLAVENWLQ